MPKIISVCGASGCGKTTLVKRLAALLGCPAIHFDDFIDTNTYPSDMQKWMLDGCDVDRISTPRLKLAIEDCRQANPSSDYIFVEDPFGRCRQEYRDIYNTVILLDTPIELCFDRILTRATIRGDSQASIDGYVVKYHAYLKSAYITSINKVKTDADVITNDCNNESDIYRLIELFEDSESSI